MLYFVREMDQAMGRIRTVVRKEPIHPMARSSKQNVEKSKECILKSYQSLVKPMTIAQLSYKTGYSETSCKKYMSVLIEDKKVIRSKLNDQMDRSFYYKKIK